MIALGEVGRDLEVYLFDPPSPFASRLEQARTDKQVVDVFLATDLLLRRRGMIHASETVAFEVGYDSTSAFISAFKIALGTTPGRYYSDRARRS